MHDPKAFIGELLERRAHSAAFCYTVTACIGGSALSTERLMENCGQRALYDLDLGLT